MIPGERSISQQAAIFCRLWDFSRVSTLATRSFPTRGLCQRKGYKVTIQLLGLRAKGHAKQESVHKYHHGLAGCRVHLQWVMSPGVSKPFCPEQQTEWSNLHPLCSPTTQLERTWDQATLKLDGGGADNASEVTCPHPSSSDLCLGGWELSNISLP